MIKFIKTKLADIKRKQNDKRKLKNMQQYYMYLKCGALFLEYINKDLDKQKEKNLNRHARRRWEKEIAKDGKFSREMIEYYSQKIDVIKSSIEFQLNPKKQKVIKNENKS